MGHTDWQRGKPDRDHRRLLARRSVDALVPGLGALLLANIIVHRDQPLVSLITTRGW